MHVAGSCENAESILRRLQTDGSLDNPAQLQPAVILYQNIDVNQVEKWWSGFLNDSWAPRINEKIAEGFITVRIQTEFQGIQSGHATMIYIAKMKPKGTTLASLNLSVKTRICLEERGNIHTIEELVSRSPSQLLGIRKLGVRCVSEIESKLGAIGLHLAANPQ